MNTSAVTQKRDLGASAAAIQHHYDVGNEFYRLWLDPSMVYSCALWSSGDENLETAQLNKMDWHLRHSLIQKGERLLDIGCGWGALLDRAVNHIGVAHATGLTLSEAQANWVRGRNLPNVDVRLESWQTHAPLKPFDGIISIGAFEHFARVDQSPEEKLDGYRMFFQFCHRYLKLGGRLCLQTISYENADLSQGNQFVIEKIFPESDVPHLEEVAKAIRGLFEVERLRNDREQYARTMQCWLSSLREKRAQAVALVGEEKVAHYEKYLGLLTVGFHTGAINLSRFVMRKIGSGVTRDFGTRGVEASRG